MIQQSNDNTKDIAPVNIKHPSITNGIRQVPSDELIAKSSYSTTSLPSENVADKMQGISLRPNFNSQNNTNEDVAKTSIVRDDISHDSSIKGTQPLRSWADDQGPQKPRVNHPKGDGQARQIIRARLMEPILKNLKAIQGHCKTPEAACWASDLLKRMRTMRDLDSADPATEVVMALHDALAYKDNWARYHEHQYEGAYLLLMRIANADFIGKTILESAIIELEDLGFSTFPYECINEDEDATIEGLEKINVRAETGLTPSTS